MPTIASTSAIPPSSESSTVFMRAVASDARRNSFIDLVSVSGNDASTRATARPSGRVSASAAPSVDGPRTTTTSERWMIGQISAGVCSNGT